MMYSPSPPEPVRRAVMVQGWNQLTFLHWPFDPDLGYLDVRASDALRRGKGVGGLEIG
jgi:uncharacterized protein YqjF (DUF2071 family)